MSIAAALSEPCEIQLLSQPSGFRLPFCLLSTKSFVGKHFCSVVCTLLPWEAAVVFLGRSRARLSLCRYTGDLGSGGPVLSLQCRRGQGKDRAREAARPFPVLSAHGVGSPFPAIFAGFVWFAPLAPSLQMSQGRERGERGASVGGCLEKGSERQGYLRVKVRQVTVLRTETLQSSGEMVKSGEAGWSRVLLVCAGGQRGGHGPTVQRQRCQPTAGHAGCAGGTGTCRAALASRGMCCCCRDIAKSKSSSWLQEHTR